MRHQDFLWKLDQHNWLPDGAKVRPGTEFVPMAGSSQPLVWGQWRRLPDVA